MSKGHGKNLSHNGTSDGSRPPYKFIAAIPEPIIVRHQDTTEDNNRYTEQKDNRSEQLKQSKILNKITAVGGIIGLLSLVGLIVNIYISRSAFIADERAWVLVSSISLQNPTIVANTPNQVVIVLKNYGKSPASHVEYRGEPGGFTGVCSRGIEVKSPYTSGMFLGPGDIATNPNNGLLVTEECVRALESGTASLSIRGTITYKDMFGRVRHTRFCTQYEGMTTKAMTACSNGNDFD